MMRCEVVEIKKPQPEEVFEARALHYKLIKINYFVAGAGVFSSA